MLKQCLSCFLAIGLVIATAFLARVDVAQADNRPWIHATSFDEQCFTASVEPDVRIHVNAPLNDEGHPARGTRLIIYALPNGNTLEQTLGCEMTDGLDWHYDVQHVAAQVRFYRSLVPEQRVVLVCAEAEGLSWPSWRGKHENGNAHIVQLVDGWRREFGEDDAEVTLTGHSGGGSFMFGLIEGDDDIRPYVDRIAYLDANYSFDAEKHGGKFIRWLEHDESRRLIVVAYDDREIVLDGKKVVGPTGGTYRASGRMRDAFGQDFPLKESKQSPFHEYTGLDGRLRFFIHPNPDNKILHTVLVGEMNALLHALTLGSHNEGAWGTFDEPRAYAKWIQRQPTQRPAKLPPRTTDAIGGKAFINAIEGLTLLDREAAILREITGGNFPEFHRKLKTVTIRATDDDGTEIVGTLQVMPDYLAVGSDADFVRMPMTPQTAQQIADQFGFTLPTRKIVNAIDEQAEVRLEPRPLTSEREAARTFLEHHEIIEQQRAGNPLGLLTSGIKKDIVLSPRIFERPERLAIYGWRKLDGQPIQNLTIVHRNRYVDYSHGARLILSEIEVAGRTTAITEMIADPKRCLLLSDEGPMNPPRYPK